MIPQIPYRNHLILTITKKLFILITQLVQKFGRFYSLKIEEEILLENDENESDLWQSWFMEFFKQSS